MTLFVKNTDTAIIGIKATAEVIWRVDGLADDGLPILGEIEHLDEVPELEIRDNAVMYVTAEGDTYPDTLIEDRRSDGSVTAARPMPPTRPLTLSVAAAWLHDVVSRQTQVGLREWAESLPDTAYLAIHGLYLKGRDWKINRAFEGAWQIAEHYEPGTVTEDASNGPWAVVSDDKPLLVKEGIEQIRARYALVE